MYNYVVGSEFKCQTNIVDSNTVVRGGHSGTGTVNGLTHVDWTLLGSQRVLGHMFDHTNVNCIWDVG